MNIIDIVLDNPGYPEPEQFAEAERSDTHASINLSSTPANEDAAYYRRLHIGLVDIIAHAPVVATYEELPEYGVVALVRKDGTVGNLVTFTKMGELRLYQWLFEEDHDEVRLLHGDTLLALPSTEEEG